MGMVIMRRILSFRAVVLLALLLSAATAFADDEINVGNGAPDYSMTAQALADMTTWVVMLMGYVVEVLYAIASILAIYNATVIYIKLQTGEDGFTKAVLMLFGACIFLIFATALLPSFFGFNANFGGSDYASPNWGELFGV